MSRDAAPIRASTAAPLLALALCSGAAGATTTQLGVRYFPDVTIVLDGQIFDDEQVAEDQLDGSVVPVSIGAVPESAALTAYHVIAGGDQLVAFEAPVSLPGGLIAAQGDVVQTNFDGTAAYGLAFDASANAVPDGAIVDAIATLGGDLLLSFDTTVALGAIIADDEDLVGFDGASFSLVFDGSAAGVPAGLDLDGAYVAANGHLLLSFDGRGAVGGVGFQDEDVLEYTPGGGTWEMAYDGSALHAGWPASNLGGAAVLTDADADGIADAYESALGVYVSPLDTGTDPLDADSDDDGYTDGYEVTQGFDPNDPGSPPLVPSLGGLGIAAALAGLLGIGWRALRRGGG